MHDKSDNENVIYSLELYQIEELSIYGKENSSQKRRRKRVFGSELKEISDINHIHGNKVNNIYEFNLLHNILNHYKHTQNIHY